MKKTVYTKAGQVGLVEVERPHIEAPDDVILRIVRTCVCGSDLWSYRNPDIEAGHQNSGHESQPAFSGRYSGLGGCYPNGHCSAIY